MAEAKDHVAFSLPYEGTSEFTSEKILDSLTDNSFFLVSTLLPYAKRPAPPRP